MTGEIKNINREKGFGFIRGTDGREYFFHRSACIGIEFEDLNRGREVTFDAEEGTKGPRAERIEA
jgi:CspA family cold shock protein